MGYIEQLEEQNEKLREEKALLEKENLSLRHLILLPKDKNTYRIDLHHIQNIYQYAADDTQKYIEQAIFDNIKDEIHNTIKEMYEAYRKTIP